MKKIKDKARKLMKGYCMVCRICDGIACAGNVPGMGGIGTGQSFISNIKALSSYKFKMKVIHDINDPDTGICLFGKKLDFPVFASPIGGVSFNMGADISEKEYIKAVLEGCHEKGIMGCTGDGVPEIIHESAFWAIKKINGNGIPFIKPWEDKELFIKIKQAIESGASIIGMDIDAAGLITLKLMGKPVSPKSKIKLKEIINNTSAKFILKGIMTPADAKQAVDAGADGIVVSNHGGRVLDHTPGAAEVLPEIAKAVKGQITVLVDGGIRSGSDILKMLALGADAVMIGRPFAIAAVGGLKDGVKKYIDQLKTELIQAMILTGCNNLQAVDRSILIPRNMGDN